MSQPINDINGAANNLLNQVKKSEAKVSFTSKLSKAELAKASEEIVSAILAEVKGSDQYNKDLQSKLSDVIMGRITYLKDKNGELSSEDLATLKSELLKNLILVQKLTAKAKNFLRRLQLSNFLTLNLKKNFSKNFKE